jgi:hypothetical protein
MKNVYAIVLHVKEYFYRLEQISTPLGIAQTFCDQQNRSTGKGKTTAVLRQERIIEARDSAMLAT